MPTAPERRQRVWPHTGIEIVFRRQMRGRRAWRDLAWTGILLGVLLIVSGVLQKTWAQDAIYGGSPPDLLNRWLTIGAAGASLLLLPCAAVLGAWAVPPREEFEATQAALLTRLTAFDLCAGRLFAGLWPLFSTLLASVAFWLAAQLGWRFQSGAGNGYGPILVAHLVLFGAVFMAGAVGFLFAGRRRPGRVWGRGAFVSLVWCTLCVTGLFAADRWLDRLKDPTGWIDAFLLANPISAVTTALGMDVLRTNWLYDRTVATQSLYAYPSPFASTAVFAALGSISLALAALRLRRAYR